MFVVGTRLLDLILPLARNGRIGCGGYSRCFGGGRRGGGGGGVVRRTFSSENGGGIERVIKAGFDRSESTKERASGVIGFGGEDYGCVGRDG